MSPTHSSSNYAPLALSDRPNVVANAISFWGYTQPARKSAARERFAALKQAQAEQVMDSAIALPPVSLSRWEWYVVFKDAQAEQHDTTFVPVPANPTGRERFATMKELQAEMREAGIH
jgi:hypothetical protein